MRFVFALLLFAGCMMTVRPVDILGPGIYCQPISDYVQECWTPRGTMYRCVDRGGRWTCTGPWRAYP